MAGLGGAAQLPKGGANLLIDLNVIAEAFVVVVVGGMGSVFGAFLAAVLIGELNAFGILILPEISLVLMFLVMAVVLVIRPWGLLGRPDAVSRAPGEAPEVPIRPANRQFRIGTAVVLLVLLLMPLIGSDYLVLLVDIFIVVLFAASLHFIMGPGGLVSFGHAAYFGLGAYATAVVIHYLDSPMEVALLVAPLIAGVGALVFGWFSVRLTGVYFAMLTLAFAQIGWSIVFQWDDFTYGDDGILGVRRAEWAESEISFYYLTLVLCGTGVWLLRRTLFTPFGYTMACRPRFRAALRRHRHRRTHAPMDRVHLRGDVRRNRGRPVRPLQGKCFSRRHGNPAIDRWPDDGALGWGQDLVGADHRRSGLSLARGRDFSARILAIHPGLRHHCPGARLPPRNRRILPRPFPACRVSRMTVLTVEDVSMAFGGVQAVDDVSFALEAGELLAMIGPNGAGKTTLFNVLNGQLTPDVGTVKLEGRELIGLQPRQIWRHGVGRTFQITATFASMTVRENVQMTLISHHRRQRACLPLARDLYVDEAMALLRRVDMADQADRACAVLAYGDIKRVELAVALAHDPKLLLMDEPTAGMAPRERVTLMELTKGDRPHPGYQRPFHGTRHGCCVRQRRPDNRAEPGRFDRRGVTGTGS